MTPDVESNNPTLELSTSPRSTWVWATDGHQAGQLRALLSAAGCSIFETRGENAEHRTIDIDIGVSALEALTILRENGYVFRWHPNQHPLNRSEDRYGVPVAGGAD